MEFKKKLLLINVQELRFYAGMVSLSFSAVILGETGMDGTAVGAAMSGISVVSMLTPPLFGMLADKIGVRKTFCIALTGASIVWFFVPLSVGVKLGTLPLTVVLLLSGTFFRASHESLMDSWLMKIQDSEPSFNYSNTRKYGSLGYAAMAALSTPLAALLGTGAVFWLMPLFLIPILFLASRIGDPGPAVGKTAPSKAKGEKLQLGRLFHSYDLMTYFACAIFMLMPFSGSGIQLQYLVGDIMGDKSMVGLLAGIKAGAEFFCFLLVPKVQKRVKPSVLICLVFGYYACEAFLLSTAHSIWVVIALMLSSGVAFAFMISTVINYIHSKAPEGLSSTVVTVNGAIMGVAGIIANNVCGILRDAAGVRTGYLVVGTVGICAVGLFILFQVLGKRLRKTA